MDLFVQAEKTVAQGQGFLGSLDSQAIVDLESLLQNIGDFCREQRFRAQLTPASKVVEFLDNIFQDTTTPESILFKAIRILANFSIDNGACREEVWSRNLLPTLLVLGRKNPEASKLQFVLAALTNLICDHEKLQLQAVESDAIFFVAQVIESEDNPEKTRWLAAKAFLHGIDCEKWLYFLKDDPQIVHRIVRALVPNSSELLLTIGCQIAMSLPRMINLDIEALFPYVVGYIRDNEMDEYVVAQGLEWLSVHLEKLYYQNPDSGGTLRMSSSLGQMADPLFVNFVVGQYSMEKPEDVRRASLRLTAVLSLETSVSNMLYSANDAAIDVLLAHAKGDLDTRTYALMILGNMMGNRWQCGNPEHEKIMSVFILAIREDAERQRRAKIDIENVKATGASELGAPACEEFERCGGEVRYNDQSSEQESSQSLPSGQPCKGITQAVDQKNSRLLHMAIMGLRNIAKNASLRTFLGKEGVLGLLSDLCQFHGDERIRLVAMGTLRLLASRTPGNQNQLLNLAVDLHRHALSSDSTRIEFARLCCQLSEYKVVHPLFSDVHFFEGMQLLLRTNSPILKEEAVDCLYRVVMTKDGDCKPQISDSQAKICRELKLEQYLSDYVSNICEGEVRQAEALDNHTRDKLYISSGETHDTAESSIHVEPSKADLVVDSIYWKACQIHEVIGSRSQT